MITDGAEARVVVDADALGRIGTALADPTRRALLLRLVDGPAYPADLADQLEVGRTNVSNHLACLRGCGLVSTRPVGRRVQYSLSDPELGGALAKLASLVLVVAAPTTCGPDDYCAHDDHEYHVREKGDGPAPGTSSGSSDERQVRDERLEDVRG